MPCEASVKTSSKLFQGSGKTSFLTSNHNRPQRRASLTKSVVKEVTVGRTVTAITLIQASIWSNGATA